MKLSMCEGEIMAIKNAARRIEAIGGNPCEKRCTPRERMACCGCDLHRKYMTIVQPITNKGLQEPLFDYLRYRQAEQDFKAALSRLKALKVDLDKKYENIDDLLTPPEIKAARPID